MEVRIRNICYLEGIEGREGMVKGFVSPLNPFQREDLEGNTKMVRNPSIAIPLMFASKQGVSFPSCSPSINEVVSKHSRANRGEFLNSTVSEYVG